MAIHGKNYPTPASKLIDGEWEWEVESILTSQCHGCKEGLQYLIKWVGYPEAENSWEPAENIHTLKLAQEFHKRYPRAVRNIKLEHIPVPEGRPSNPHPVASRAETPLPCLKNRASPASMTLCTQRKTVSLTLHCHRPYRPSTVMAMSLMKEKIQHPHPTLKDMMTCTWWEDHALCHLCRPRQMETIWNPGAWEMISPLKMSLAAIWDPPGSGGRKEEGT
jgi:hypothetical protein